MNSPEYQINPDGTYVQATHNEVGEGGQVEWNKQKQKQREMFFKTDLKL